MADSGETKRTQDQVSHGSRSPGKKARDEAVLEFCGLKSQRKGGGVLRLGKIHEQLELFPEKISP